MNDSGSSLAHRDLMEAIDQVIDHLHTGNLIALAGELRRTGVGTHIDRADQLLHEALDRVTPPREPVARPVISTVEARTPERPPT
jgi:hypothetical protein